MAVHLATTKFFWITKVARAASCTSHLDILAWHMHWSIDLHREQCSMFGVHVEELCFWIQFFFFFVFDYPFGSIPSLQCLWCSLFLLMLWLFCNNCYEEPYFYIFTSYHILSGLILSMDCFIICSVTNHTPFHYQSCTHVRHMPNTWMTSYMPIPHGLPIEYTPPTLVAHMVVSVLLLTCSYHLYLMVSRTSSIQHWVKGVEHP